MKDNKNIWCVYKHTNKINGKCYIGITKTIPEKRWGKNGIGYKYQNFWYAIKKYGWNNFEHEILFCNLTEKECKDKEIQLIKKYNSIAPNGYNITHGGDGSLGLFPNEKTKEKQSLSAKKRTDLKKEVICFETLETFNSATDCSLYINVDRSNIINNCNGKYKCVKKLHFVYKENYKDELNNYYIKGETIKSLLLKNKNNHSNNKEIICLETKEIFNNVEFAGKFLGIKNAKISTINIPRYSKSKYDNKKYHFMKLEEYKKAKEQDIQKIMSFTQQKNVSKKKLLV